MSGPAPATYDLEIATHDHLIQRRVRYLRAERVDVQEVDGTRVTLRLTPGGNVQFDGHVLTGGMVGAARVQVDLTALGSRRSRRALRVLDKARADGRSCDLELTLKAVSAAPSDHPVPG